MQLTYIKMLDPTLSTNRWLADADGCASSAGREGLEHLSADERVHIAFGNDWALRLLGDQP